MSKLRIEWRTPRPTELPADFEERVFAQVCQLQPRRPATSQDECLAFSSDARGVRLEYVFDHDFASQYDRTERWTAVVELDAGGPRLTAWSGQPR